MKQETPEYTIYMVACAQGPSGRNPTIEQIKAGSCGDSQFRSHPDAVSEMVTIILAALLIGMCALLVSRCIISIAEKIWRNYED